MIVGKKYFIPKEKYKDFYKYCLRVSISECSIKRFDNEKAIMVERYNGGSSVKFQNDYTWNWPKNYAEVFRIYLNFKHEEMEI